MAADPVCYEVEQKYRVLQVNALQERLEQVGIVYAGMAEQTDAYFSHPARDFAATDEALRIRRTGEQNRVTYKGPRIDAITKTRRELELQLPTGEQYAAQFGELLSLLGFEPVATVAKQRRTGHVRWRGREVEIALDEVAQVGSFIELELQAKPHQLDEAQAVVHSLAAELQLDQPERRSYLEMWLESRPG